MNRFAAQTRLATVILAMLIVTPGCEVGRTMFQYSSNSNSPWVGIDLLPRKPRATKISHQQVKKSDDRSSSMPVSLVHDEVEVKKFGKHPIRLELPSQEISDSSREPASIAPESGKIPVDQNVTF